jgi:hypothetical protein
LQTKFVEKIKIHTLCSVTSSFPYFVPFVRKYCTAGQATDDKIIRRVLVVCWITKATDTNSEYVIIIAFPWQQWLRECASILRYTCIVSLVRVLPIYVTSSRSDSMTAAQTKLSGHVATSPTHLNLCASINLMTVRDGTNCAGCYVTFHQALCRMFRQQMCLLKGEDSGVYYTGKQISIFFCICDEYVINLFFCIYEVRKGT